jgi:hypothetical protein
MEATPWLLVEETMGSMHDKVATATTLSAHNVKSASSTVPLPTSVGTNMMKTTSLIRGTWL